MKYEKYELVLTAQDGSGYKFTSIGPKGEIQIAVQFTDTNDPNLANLGFGNLLPNGEIDDEAKNANLDRDKILATVSNAVFQFTTAYPNKLIVFRGSTESRNRLYRMAISANLEELDELYDIYGWQKRNAAVRMMKFKKNYSYYAFAVKRKF